MSVKMILMYILKIVGVIVGIVVLYALLGYLLPFIEVRAKEGDQKKEIPIYIYTNGVHTDIVMPVKNDLQDWSSKIPFSNVRSGQTDYNYIGIGWGDKGFYLDTPTWADLKFSTAFKAAFWLSESAMHCTYYKTMKEGSDCKMVMISRAQYKDLIQFVEAKFDKDQNGNFILIPTDAVYSDNDALKAAGQKAAFWTPSDFGIFQHYK